MKGLSVIYESGNEVAKIIRKKTASVDGLKFLSNPEESLQFAIHEHKYGKETNIHTNQLDKPVIVREKQKFIYIVKGKARVELLKKTGIVFKSITLESGDAIIIKNTIHKVLFLPKARAFEIKLGPYEKR